MSAGVESGHARPTGWDPGWGSGALQVQAAEVPEGADHPTAQVPSQDQARSGAG